MIAPGSDLHNRPFATIRVKVLVVPGTRSLNFNFFGVKPPIVRVAPSLKSCPVKISVYAPDGSRSILQLVMKANSGGTGLPPLEGLARQVKVTATPCSLPSG